MFESIKESLDAVLNTNLYTATVDTVMYTGWYPGDLISGVAFVCAWFGVFSMVYYFTIIPSIRGIFFLGIRSGKQKYKEIEVDIDEEFNSHKTKRVPRFAMRQSPVPQQKQIQSSSRSGSPMNSPSRFQSPSGRGPSFSRGSYSPRARQANRSASRNNEVSLSTRFRRDSRNPSPMRNDARKTFGQEQRNAFKPQIVDTVSRSRHPPSKGSSVEQLQVRNAGIDDRGRMTM